MKSRRRVNSDVRRPRYMPKSDLADQMDEIQARLRPLLKDEGYVVRGRTFNRRTPDGLVQVVNLQMGSFDPPGTTYIRGLRENMYGKFAVNLGVYVPEVALYHHGGEAKSFVREYNCCIRARLGATRPEKKEFWWIVRASDEVIFDVMEELVRHGLPFLDRFHSRDRILHELMGLTENIFLSPPRIVCAIILAARGDMKAARSLLEAQSRETRNPKHPEYVRALAQRLGLGNLDGEQIVGPERG
jgi:Domain of unknown function (DUF4304)